MYDLFRSLVDKKVVYYCGDAAGRKKDFSVAMNKIEKKDQE